MTPIESRDHRWSHFLVPMPRILPALSVPLGLAFASGEASVSLIFGRWLVARCETGTPCIVNLKTMQLLETFSARRCHVVYGWT